MKSRLLFVMDLAVMLVGTPIEVTAFEREEMGVRNILSVG